jgi:hypothetical protein
MIVIGGQRHFSLNEIIHSQRELKQATTIKNYKHKPYKIPGICLNIKLYHTSNIEAKELKLVNEDGSEMTAIKEIDSHTTSYDPAQNRLYIFGGYINQASISDKLYMIDLDKMIFKEAKVQ